MKYLLLTLILLTTAVSAQEMPLLAKHGIYLEGEGSSYYYSLNYENRYNNNVRLRGGLTLLQDVGGNGTSALSIPVSYSYLIAFFHSKVELGASINFLFLTNKKFPGFKERASGFYLIPSVLFGYRYEPDIEGLYYRIFLAPVFSRDVGVTNLGLSIGYGFKDFGFFSRIFK